MRTTIDLDEQILTRIKGIAAKTGQTMTAVIEDALRHSLMQTRPKARKPIHLTTVSGKGLKPGVDLDDSASLVDLMERKR
jgi:hypothetical protein